MAVNWGEMAKSFIQGQTWEENFEIWKISNVLGWSLSNVLTWSSSTIMGWYMCNYGLVKTQLMMGYERKINIREKYEWYMTAPTKVLLEGENKIDLKEMKKISPNDTHLGLSWIRTASEVQINSFEKALKTAKETKTIGGPSTTTCVGHTLNVTGGNSTETVVTGNKLISAAAGTLQLFAPAQGIDLLAGASSMQLMPGGVTIAGPVINLG